LPTTDELLRHFERQIELPWRDDLAPEYRVWILHYDQALERRSRSRIREFEAITWRHGKGWFAVDLAALVAPWFAAHAPFEALVEQPDELPGLLPDLPTTSWRQYARASPPPGRAICSRFWVRPLSSA
jgi:hypothetical protein